MVTLQQLGGLCFSIFLLGDLVRPQRNTSPCNPYNSTAPLPSQLRDNITTCGTARVSQFYVLEQPESLLSACFPTSRGGNYTPCGFAPVTGEMWRSRLHQHLLANGIAVVTVGNYASDTWDLNGQVLECSMNLLKSYTLFRRYGTRDLTNLFLLASLRHFG
jgi:hypothetical protein